MSHYVFVFRYLNSFNIRDIYCRGKVKLVTFGLYPVLGCVLDKCIEYGPH